MNTYVFVFIPIGQSPDQFQERLRDCLASLPDKPIPQSTARPASWGTAERPLWTWFIPNPLPAPTN